MLEENILLGPITDIAIVEQFIPQKAPFVMVDKLFFWSEKKVIAGLTIKAEDLFTVNGYFTEPGIIEHLAQSVALHTGYSYYIKQEAAPVGYLGSIKKVEIKRLPQVNEQLKTTVTILHELMGVTMVNISSSFGKELIATAEMKTVIAE